jgi:hypothetical protein
LQVFWLDPKRYVVNCFRRKAFLAISKNVDHFGVL